jgi:hypothetical protein
VREGRTGNSLVVLDLWGGGGRNAELRREGPRGDRAREK